MHAFDVLGDPVRLRILELLADGEQTSGAVTDVIRASGALAQPAGFRTDPGRTDPPTERT